MNRLALSMNVESFEVFCCVLGRFKASLSLTPASVTVHIGSDTLSVEVSKWGDYVVIPVNTSKSDADGIQLLTGVTKQQVC